MHVQTSPAWPILWIVLLTGWPTTACKTPSAGASLQAGAVLTTAVLGGRPTRKGELTQVKEIIVYKNGRGYRGSGFWRYPDQFWTAGHVLNSNTQFDKIVISGEGQTPLLELVDRADFTIANPESYGRDALSMAKNHHYVPDLLRSDLGVLHLAFDYADVKDLAAFADRGIAVGETIILGGYGANAQARYKPGEEVVKSIGFNEVRVIEGSYAHGIFVQKTNGLGEMGEAGAVPTFGDSGGVGLNAERQVVGIISGGERSAGALVNIHDPGVGRFIQQQTSRHGHDDLFVARGYANGVPLDREGKPVESSRASATAEASDRGNNADGAGEDKSSDRGAADAAAPAKRSGAAR